MNIHSLPWLKFGHDDYIFSDFRFVASAIAKAAYFELLCFAMKQTPALSLPNNDSIFSAWLGISPAQWLDIKDLVLAQFSFNPSDNRYYSPMLLKLYSENERPQPTEQPPLKQAKSNAERQKAYKERKKANVTVNSKNNAEVTASNSIENETVTTDNVAIHEKVTAGNVDFVTFGGIKGGELEPELKLKLKEEKEMVIVSAPASKKLTITTTRFLMSFDFQPQPNAIALLMDKLNVEISKHTVENLNHFIAHYQAKDYKNSQAEWELHYVKWLQRENRQPAANIAKPAPINTRSVHLMVVKPLWETVSERKIELAAIPPRDATVLAIADAALATMKKTLGMRGVY